MFMHLMRFSILNVSAVILFLSALISLFVNPFGYMEFAPLVLFLLLLAASLVILLFDIVIKVLKMKIGRWYLFIQILTLKVVLGMLFVFYIKIF